MDKPVDETRPREDRFDLLIEKYSCQFFPEQWARGSVPLLVKAQIWQESRFDPDAQSPCGAKGLMQLMPGTDFWLDKDFDGFDPEGNIENGIRYDRWLFDRFPEIPEREERLKFMLASYNCGRGYVNAALRLARIEEFGFEPLALVKGQWQTWKMACKFLASPSCMVAGKRPDYEQVWKYVDKIWGKFQKYSSEFGVPRVRS